ncbi:MAG TPA: indole-3-glycerol-phosphate synthase [Spirochaetota bacterium]|nr:indole-3-glycerol-phosphate synthase [Spirochaetota bacterium]
MKEKFALNAMKHLKEGELPSIKELLRSFPGRSRRVYTLEKEKRGVIAEVKKASPSRGSIRTVEPRRQASEYSRGGAAALSVLVDGNYFGGSWGDLREVCDAAEVPVLCKEFIYFEEQIDLAAVCGADMVLLIARCLEAGRLRELYAHAESLGMLPLVEVHHREELPAVLELDPGFLMVNMRNLETLAMDFDAGIAALKEIPSGVTKISASGMDSALAVQAVAGGTGTGLFLVGTALMESHDPGAMIQEITDVC